MKKLNKDAVIVIASVTYTVTLLLVTLIALALR